MRLLKTNLLMTMIALCVSVTVNAQIVIHGTVTDTEGPLMGATVAVKGSTGNTADSPCISRHRAPDAYCASLRSSPRGNRRRSR